MGPEDLGRVFGFFIAGIVIVVFAVTSLFWWIIG